MVIEHVEQEQSECAKYCFRIRMASENGPQKTFRYTKLTFENNLNNGWSVKSLKNMNILKIGQVSVVIL